MEREELFAMALEINEPLYIKKIDFDKDIGELNIYIDFRKGSKFKCSVCGKKENPVYDTETKTWRHLNFSQYKAFIHFRTPRTDCEIDGIHRFIPPWSGKKDFTLLMDLMIIELAKSMPIKRISEMLEEQDTKIWRVVKSYVNKAHEIQDFSKLEKVGVDETSSKRGHNYVTVFVDMDESKVVYATEGKDSSTINEFKEELPVHRCNPETIDNFSADMSPAFKKGIKENFPWENVTFDKFHVMKLINEAVNKTRRMESKECIELKSTRYLWLKNKCYLNKQELEKIDTISKKNRKTARAYQMKLALQDIYSKVTDKTEASVRLNKLYNWAIRSRIEPMKIFAKTLK